MDRLRRFFQPGHVIDLSWSFRWRKRAKKEVVADKQAEPALAQETAPEPSSETSPASGQESVESMLDWLKRLFGPGHKLDISWLFSWGKIIDWLKRLLHRAKKEIVADKQAEPALAQETVQEPSPETSPASGQEKVESILRAGQEKVES
ncbi:MAG: hypothetical protein AABZ77_03655, partial [Chloroflexota bacterium]